MNTSNMKFAVLTILLSIVLISCSSDEPRTKSDTSSSDGFKFGETIVVKVQNQARIGSSSGADIDVQVTAITDSRCPVDAICVWEGRAEVTFKIEGIEPVILCLGNAASCTANPYEFSVADKKYSLTLKEVTPVPSSINQGEEKKASFVVEEVK